LGIDADAELIRNVRTFSLWAVKQLTFWANFWDAAKNPYVHREELALNGGYRGRNVSEILFIDADNVLLNNWNLGQRIAKAYSDYCATADCQGIDLDIADVSIGLSAAFAGDASGDLYAGRGLIGRLNLSQAHCDVLTFTAPASV
jgi:hypothetical protein